MLILFICTEAIDKTNLFAHDWMYHWGSMIIMCVTQKYLIPKLITLTPVGTSTNKQTLS